MCKYFLWECFFFFWGGGGGGERVSGAWYLLVTESMVHVAKMLQF